MTGLALAAAVCLGACSSDSTGPTIANVHGAYVLTDTLANGAWVHTSAGVLTLSADHTYEMLLPVMQQLPRDYTGNWKMESGLIVLSSNPIFYLQLVTKDLGLTSDAQIVVSNRSTFSPTQASSGYAFKQVP